MHGHRMTDEQKKLWEEIDEILWKDWDPIGVNDISDARDEYQSYTPAIFKLKIDGADIETIAKMLLSVERDQMGFDGSLEQCLEVAQKINTLIYK